MLFSLGMLPPIGVEWWYGDGDLWAFVFGFGITLSIGFLLWVFSRKHEYELKARDGFLIVSLFWFVLSLFGALPLMVVLYPKLSFTDAVFESVSGLTTTGATVLSHLDIMPHSFLYYREQLHFLGGIGIVVLAVAVLPMLGIGGMQLYRAEIAGPVKNTKLTPRIAETAKALWIIYFILTGACILCYWGAGMSLFDAIGESFSTISTGGFSNHDASFAYYNSKAIDTIGMIFMFLGGTNFALHFHFLKGHSIKTYFKDQEFRGYLATTGALIFICAVTLSAYHYYHGYNNWFNAAFSVVSMITTTGLTTTNFSLWPTFLPFILMLSALIGSCSGSTCGGFKIIRCLLLKEQSKREFQRLIHPKGVCAIKLGSDILEESVIQAIWGFASIFITTFIALLLLILASGVDVTTAFGALAACFSNAGSGIGAVASNFGGLNAFTKWVLILAMLAGRLEIFTLLVLFMPSYWKR